MNTQHVADRMLPTLLALGVVFLPMLLSATHLCFAESTNLVNPIDSPDIQTFLKKVIEVLLIFAVPLIILFIMYAGYLFVVAQGNPSKIEEARSALLWAVIGGVIVLGANVIYGVINGTIKAL